MQIKNNISNSFHRVNRNYDPGNRVVRRDTVYSKSTFQGKRVTLKQALAFAGSRLQKSLDKPLNLIYMGDHHKSVETMPRIKSAIDDYRENLENPFVIHTGDYGMGKGGLEEQVGFLNRLGVMFSTFGNHEFYNRTKDIAKALMQADFKTIVANLSIPEKDPLKGAEAKDKLVNSVIKEIDGTKYAFIGAVTDDINKPEYQKTANGVIALDPVEVLSKEVKGLEDQGINRIVLVSHLGYPNDKKVARKVPGIDVIVGGHSHIALPGIKNETGYPETSGEIKLSDEYSDDNPLRPKDWTNLIWSEERHEPVLLVQPGAYGLAVGVSNVVFDDKGVLKVEPDKKPRQPMFVTKDMKSQTLQNVAKTNKTQSFLVDIDSYPEDREMRKAVDNFNSKMEKIATVDKTITGNWPTWGVNEVGCLTADGVRELTGADIGLVHAGAVRQAINKGNVYSEIINEQVIPFKKKLVKSEIKGSDLMAALQYAATAVGTRYRPGLLQVSGLKYTVDMSKDKESRVVDVKIQNGDTYEPLNVNKTYTIAGDSYLIGGGDGYETFAKAKQIKEYSDESLASALIKYIKQQNVNSRNLNQSYSDRIVVINRPEA